MVYKGTVTKENNEKKNELKPKTALPFIFFFS